jgi:hypothetical protein
MDRETTKKCIQFLIKISSSIIKKGTLWSWLYGSWIYNYLCNQCLSPLTLWVWIPLRRSVLETTLCDKVCQWLATAQWFSEYKWNIVESGAKHHSPNPQLLSYILHKWEKLSLHLCFTKITKLSLHLCFTKMTKLSLHLCFTKMTKLSLQLCFTKMTKLSLQLCFTKMTKLSLHLCFTKMTKLSPCKKFSNFVFYWKQGFFFKIILHANGL